MGRRIRVRAILNRRQIFLTVLALVLSFLVLRYFTGWPEHFSPSDYVMRSRWDSHSSQIAELNKYALGLWSSTTLDVVVIWPNEDPGGWVESRGADVDQTLSMDPNDKRRMLRLMAGLEIGEVSIDQRGAWFETWTNDELAGLPTSRGYYYYDDAIWSRRYGNASSSNSNHVRELVADAKRAGTMISVKPVGDNWSYYRMRED